MSTPPRPSRCASIVVGLLAHQLHLRWCLAWYKAARRAGPLVKPLGWPVKLRTMLRTRKLAGLAEKSSVTSQIEIPSTSSMTITLALLSCRITHRAALCSRPTTHAEVLAHHPMAPSTTPTASSAHMSTVGIELCAALPTHWVFFNTTLCERKAAAEGGEENFSQFLMC